MPPAAASLAIGVPAWPSAGGGWDPWLLITIVLAVLLLPRLLGTRRTPAVLAACVGTGVLLATALEVWGLPAAAAAVVAIGVLVAGVAATRRRRRPPV